MREYTDPAWEEYLTTGEDPTGGALEEADGLDGEDVENETEQSFPPA